jgi:hypothetical protein
MNIDIDHLTESELLDLNHRIVHRLRFMREARAHSAMLQFKIGDQVYFRASDGRTVTGILTRYNKKSVTVVTADGHRWTVAPQLLIRVGDAESRDSSITNPQRLSE